LSPRTQKSYWWHIQDYQKFIKQDLENTGIEELRSYFQSILSDGIHKPGSVKMGYFALRFLFVNVYHKEWAKEYLPTPKVAKTLPLVLSKEEVFDVLSVIKNFKHRTVIMFIYSTGTRVSECINIKLTDIDSKRMQINIQEGKGLKQRKVPLSPPGGLSFDKSHWVHTQKSKDFFIYYKVISRKFRGKFLDLLQSAYNNNELSFKGKLKSISGKNNFKALLSLLYKRDWVVNIQKPFAHPEKVLEYLSRYVFRIAISDRRIEKVENGMVYFSIKDYKTMAFFGK